MSLRCVSGGGSDSHSQHPQEHSEVPLLAENTPAPPTSYLSSELDLWQTGPGRRVPQRQPRSSIEAQPTHSLSHSVLTLASAFSTLQPCTRSGRNTTGGGMQAQAASEWSPGHLHRSCIGLL